MKILVERFDSGSFDTLGRLYIDGKFYCYTLEDEYREVKVKGDTRIPEGIYKVVFYDSPSHGKDTLMIADVPNFKYILIHPGNTEDDTMGCLLPGLRIGSINNKRAVLDSKVAYKKIYDIIAPALHRGEEVTIKYMVV
jgi:hypothetical protein